MKIGNIVKPTSESGFILASGCGRYSEAVVISEEPFVLTSLESDMRWESTIKKEDFEVIGEADNSTLKKCNRRLLG